MRYKTQQILLNEYGIPVTEEQCILYSNEHSRHNGEDNLFEDVDKVPNNCDVLNHQKYDADIFDIINELSLGHKIIVGADAKELWSNRFCGILS